MHADVKRTLTELLGIEDPGGVLTINVGFPPESFADGGPTGPKEVREKLRRLPEQAEDPQAVRDRIDAIGPRLNALLDPSTDGRGRLLVAGVSEGHVEEMRLQVPLPSEATYDSGPVLRHVLEVLDENQPAAALLLHAEEAALLRIELGAHEPVGNWSIRLGDAVFADEFQGPAPSSPSVPGASGVSHKEQQEDRIQANRDRFMKEVADDVRKELEQGSVDRIVLVGPAHERNVIRDAIDSVPDLRVLELDTVDPGDVTRTMREVQLALSREHAEVEKELVRTAADRALADGAGVIGAGAVAEALTEGRVHHLLLAPDISLEGFVDEQGLLVLDPDDPRAQNARPEPRFVHKMIERALATDARVTPVDGPAAAMLSEHGDIAALLRW